MPDIFDPEYAQLVIETLLHSLWQVGLLFLLWRMLFSTKSQSLESIKTSFIYIIPFAIVAMSVFTFYWIASPLNPMTEASSGVNIFIGPKANVSSWSPWIIRLTMSLWIIGIIIQGLKLLMSYINLRHFRQRTFSLVDHTLVRMTHDLAQRMNITQKIQIKFSKDISSPLVAGFFKPIVLFPFCLVNQLSLEEAEAILAHELNHIKNHDYLFNIYLSFLEIIFFFNPFVLHLVREIRTEREIACDQAALENNSNKTQFAAALIRIQEIQMDVRPALGLQGEGEFSYRIKRILGVPSSRPTIDSKSLIKSLSLLAILPFLFSFMHINDTDTEGCTDIMTAFSTDTITLPEVTEEIYSLEYKKVGGKIKDLSINDGQLHSPSRKQAESLKSNKSETNTANNRFEEYQVYLNESLPTHKEQLRITRQRKATKNRQSAQSPQTRKTIKIVEDHRALSFNRSLESGYRFGKSFDTLLLNMDEDVFLIGDKKWTFERQTHQFTMDDDFKVKHIIVIPDATEGTKDVKNVVIHYETLMHDVLDQIKSSVNNNSRLEDNIEKQLISWSVLDQNESYNLLLTNDLLMINGRIQDKLLQQNLETYYLEFTGKNPRSIFNYQIIKNN